MPNDRRGARFSERAAARHGRGLAHALDELERDPLTRLDVLGFPHGAHSALAQRANELIALGDDRARTAPRQTEAVVGHGRKELTTGAKRPCDRRMNRATARRQHERARLTAEVERRNLRRAAWT